LDDGVQDDRDRQLATIKAAHADHSTSTESVAAELADYAALARQEAAGFAGLGGFDIALIDEVERLPKQLRELPVNTASPAKAKRALEIRNRIATLLVDPAVEPAAATVGE
jgi:hypothetical protein